MTALIKFSSDIYLWNLVRNFKMTTSEHAVWLDNLLKAVEEVGDEGRAAVDFLHSHRTKIGFKRARSNIAAFWTLFGDIWLNSRHYDYNSPLDGTRIKTLIIHEVHHLRQGFFKSLSVYGELEAWQLEFSIYHRLEGKYPRPVIAELMKLPLEYDRDVLKKAVKIMHEFAGKGYRANLLPLYPLNREIRYWFARK